MKFKLSLPLWTLASPALAWLLFAAKGITASSYYSILLGVALIGAILAAVYHAEVVAHRVGEPFGTLVLAIAVTVIEASLIISLMLSGGHDVETLARDTVLAAIMIILTGIIGLCLLFGSVYIYGIYKEDDNDFHMIIGNGKTGSSMKLLNAEVSGLPGDTNDSLLIVVRNKIITRFGDIACKDGAYKPVNAFIPIQIRGSIFFDIDHKAGIVGFGIYKPTTAWEIHPVTGITFLDE